MASKTSVSVFYPVTIYMKYLRNSPESSEGNLRRSLPDGCFNQYSYAFCYAFSVTLILSLWPSELKLFSAAWHSFNRKGGECLPSKQPASAGQATLLGRVSRSLLTHRTFLCSQTGNCEGALENSPCFF